MFPYILFDLDGTVSDPKEGITASVQYALRSFGIEEPDKDKLEPFIGPPLTDSFMEFYGFTREQAEAAVVKYRERFSVTGKYENKLYPGMAQLLAGLQGAGAHLAIASSKPEVFVEDILAYFGIRQYFEVVVGSELDGTRVRKEEVVQEALRRLRVTDCSQVAMVGDRRFDIEGAKAIGAHSVGVTYGYAGPGELQAAGAEFLVNDVEGLRRVLTEFGSAPVRPSHAAQGRTSAPGGSPYTAQGQASAPGGNPYTAQGQASASGVFSGEENGYYRDRYRGTRSRKPETGFQLGLKAIGVSALAIGLYFIVTLSVSMLALIVGSVLEGIRNVGSFGVFRLYTDDLWLNLGNAFGIAAAFAACFGIWHKQVQFRPAGPVDRLSLLPMGILAASLSVGLNGVLSLLELYRFSPTFQEVSEMQVSVPVWLGILSYAVLAPLGEEFLFRGVVYGQLRRVCSAPVAIAVSALAFGLFHGNLVQFVYATLLGAVMALVRELYGTLWASVVFHAIANLFVYAVLDLSPVGEAFVTAPVTLFFLGISAVCLVFMVIWQKNTAA